MRHFRRLRRPRSSHRSFVLRPAGQAFAIEGSVISIYRLRRVTFWSIVRQRAKFVRDTVHRRMLFSIHRRSNLYRLCCHFGRWRAPAGPSRPGGWTAAHFRGTCPQPRQLSLHKWPSLPLLAARISLPCIRVVTIAPVAPVAQRVFRRRYGAAA